MSALTLDDFARLAELSLGPAIWDIVEGGAGELRALAADRDAFDEIRLRPAVTCAGGGPRFATTILGRIWAAPVAVAPPAGQALVHPDGELATVRAAAEADLPVVVSTFARRTFEDLAAVAGARLWLRLHCFGDPAITQGLVERAESAGVEALVVTMDPPLTGTHGRRDESGPPPGVRPANFPEGDRVARGMYAPAEIDWSIVEWLRSVSGLPILVRGVLTEPDALRAIETGADGIVVSGHGGAPPALGVLPEIAAAVAGKCPVLLDGGARRGADVLASVALGADAVLLVRPVLHGLAVGQRAGVDQVLKIILAELADAMLLTGISSLDEAGPDLIMTTAPPKRPRATLQRADLHPSLSDPLMETMNFLNEITLRHPGAISFAPGRPHDKFFTTEQIFEYVRRYLDHLADGGRSPQEIRAAMYQYGPTAGQIRELIADSLRADENIDVPAESIVVTVGAQEAMLLVLRALISGPADVLLVSSPCYVGISGAARILDIPVAPVVERDDGLAPADVEAALETELARGRRPRALYVTPDHSNPSGRTMSMDGRLALLDLAGRYDLLVLEDSPYRLVSPGRQLPTLKSLDRERRVIHLGSFSKTIFPGARVGFAVADQPVVGDDGETSLLADELAKIKSMVTVNTSALSQAAVAGALLAAGGGVTALNVDPAAHYGASMRIMLEQLDRQLPAARRSELGVAWNRPTGGFFLTVEVPFDADNAALSRSAMRFGVLWTPMSYFYPGGGGERAIRLSTSYLTPAEIEEGTARLIRFVESEIERSVDGA